MEAFALVIVFTPSLKLNDTGVMTDRLRLSPKGDANVNDPVTESLVV